MAAAAAAADEGAAAVVVVAADFMAAVAVVADPVAVAAPDPRRLIPLRLVARGQPRGPRACPTSVARAAAHDRVAEARRRVQAAAALRDRVAAARDLGVAPRADPISPHALAAVQVLRALVAVRADRTLPDAPVVVARAIGPALATDRALAIGPASTIGQVALVAATDRASVIGLARVTDRAQGIDRALPIGPASETDPAAT